MVRGILVDEDVDEHHTSGLEPPCAPFEQLVVVLHVLEHLDGDDAVVLARLWSFKRDHVGGDDR